jgi:hypothetical protein
VWPCRVVACLGDWGVQRQAVGVLCMVLRVRVLEEYPGRGRGGICTSKEKLPSILRCSEVGMFAG